MSLLFPWLAPRRRELDPGFLIIAGSHGFPPTRARTVRLAEIAWQIARRGSPVDLLVLTERHLQPMEEETLHALVHKVRRLDIVPHPRTLHGPSSLAFRAVTSLLGNKLGGAAHVPWGFLRRIAAEHAPRNYRGVIVQGVHLAPCLAAFPDWTERLIDIERIGSDAYLEHQVHGKGSELAVFGDGRQEIELLGTANAVIVTSVGDAVSLREKGLSQDIVLAPPLGIRDVRHGGERPSVPPLRPHRILFVGSASEANVDGIHWFRKQVLPRILEKAPAVRLRIVGEVARMIEPGPALDRIGWVEDLKDEYRDAAVVALPIRMGSGIRRRAVEALFHGKALATTLTGARGTGIVAGRDAIVSDDPEALAASIVDVLSSDAERLRYETRSAALAAEKFDPSKAYAPLAERLGLSDAPVRESVPAGPVAVTS